MPNTALEDKYALSFDVQKHHVRVRSGYKECGIPESYPRIVPRMPAEMDEIIIIVNVDNVLLNEV